MVSAKYLFKGKQVFEEHPAYRFWMTQHHTSNFPKYLLYRRIYRIIFKTCQLLSGDYLVPVEYWSWGRIYVGDRLCDPCTRFAELFWKRENEKYERSRHGLIVPFVDEKSSRKSMTHLTRSVMDVGKQTMPIWKCIYDSKEARALSSKRNEYTLL